MNIILNENLKEKQMNIKNIGWSLGNYCPYNCKHCYSVSVRKRGADFTRSMIDTIIQKIEQLNVDTVNFGGNEPWFTNGPTGKSLLPYIIKEIKQRGIKVGITTAGITLHKMHKHNPEILKLIDDVDISLDSPIREEHNENRGALLYDDAIKAIELCTEYEIDKSIIMCAMDWNFDIGRIKLLMEICDRHNANMRFNFLKPTSKDLINKMVPQEQYYKVMGYVLNNCVTIDITEPKLSTLVNNTASERCPCGTTSMRIHSITLEGKIPVSPCVYLHDLKYGNLLEDNIFDIVTSEPFKELRRRNENPEQITECEGCERITICGGGCAASAYLYNKHENGILSVFTKESNCWRDLDNEIDVSSYKFDSDVESLVHMNYLCTWIGYPKN